MCTFTDSLDTSSIAHVMDEIKRFREIYTKYFSSD